VRRFISIVMSIAIVLIGAGISLAQAPAGQASSMPVHPPGEANAKAALDKSPRHGEWVDVKITDAKTVRCFVVYPEVKDKAPVVIVIQEIYGLTDWIRSVADRLAADGFVAIAPDFLSGMGPNGGGTESFASRDEVTKAVRALKSEDVVATLNAVREYGKSLPASTGKTATIGFCWGGAQSFDYATRQPDLAAAVVCYGTNPKDADAIKRINAPVLGLYGADDARVNATVGPADEAMKTAGKTYEHHTYDGTGHGFFRQQDGRNGANLKATEQAWPAAIAFLREHTK
jgi:carboxymethylenebutenolidase